MKTLITMDNTKTVFYETDDNKIHVGYLVMVTDDNTAALVETEPNVYHLVSLSSKPELKDIP